MIVGPGYHWSPAHNREAIVKDGLALVTPMTSAREDVSQGIMPHICASLDPRTAWSLSGDTDWGEEFEDWDLWEIHWADNDMLRFRPLAGPRIIEVKIYNPVPPDRLWWVGTRQPWLTFGPTGG